MNRGVHPPKKLLKILKNRKRFTYIFKKCGIFWLDAFFHLFSDRLRLCFSQQKFTEFILDIDVDRQKMASADLVL